MGIIWSKPRNDYVHKSDLLPPSLTPSSSFAHLVPGSVNEPPVTDVSNQMIIAQLQSMQTFMTNMINDMSTGFINVHFELQGLSYISEKLRIGEYHE